MRGKGNVSKKTAGLIVDDEVEHASKTTLCNKIEGGTRGDE